MIGSLVFSLAMTKHTHAANYVTQPVQNRIALMADNIARKPLVCYYLDGLLPYQPRPRQHSIHT